MRGALAAQRLRLGSAVRTETLRDLLVGCARSDPRLALELASKWARNADEKIRFEAAIVAPWARKAPRAAWAWVREHVDGLEVDGDNSSVTALLQSIAARDPQLALSYVQDARRGGEASADLAQATSVGVVALVTTGQVGLASAVVDRWLREPGAPPVGESVVTTVALALARDRSPGEAAAWLLRLPRSPDLAATASALAAAWAESDPAAAMDWAQALPTEQRGGATQRAFGVWADHDVGAAAAWFLAHESQPGSDPLIPTLIEQSHLDYGHPLAAVEWASLPTDPAVRSRSLELAFRQWAARDRPSALRFVADTTLLSSDQRTRILADLRAGG